MGVETDVLLDTGRPYDEVLSSHQPSTDFGGVYAKGLDHFNVLILASILSGREPPLFDDPDDAMDGFDMVASSRDHDVGLWKLPADAAIALRSLPNQDLDAVAEQWIQHPFFELMDWDDELTIQFLDDMSRLITESRPMDSDILLWVST